MHLGAEHIFGSMLELWTEAPAGLPPADTLQLLANAPMLPSMWCHRHFCHCPVVPPAARIDFDMTGTPCTDYSSAGSRQGWNGPTFPVLVTWAQHMIRARVPCWIHENVVAQPLWLLQLLLGEHYIIMPLNLSPKSVGFGLLERKRVYTLGVHKQEATLTANPYEVMQFVQGKLSRVQPQPKDCLMADIREIIQEAREVCELRGAQLPPGLEHATADNLDLSGLLTERERAAVIGFTHAYLERFGTDPAQDPNAVWFLGDNPSARLTWSCASGAIPTFRTNNGNMWLPARRRWLTNLEALSSMGFPVYEATARFMGVPLMTFESPGDARRFLGNAMHMGCAGVALIVCLSCVSLNQAL